MGCALILAGSHSIGAESESTIRQRDNDMSDQDRDRIRAKQDRLIDLAIAKHIHLDLQISGEYAGAPTIRNLINVLWPDWESVIDSAITYLERKG
jgi:hypothetical protein